KDKEGRIHVSLVNIDAQKSQEVSVDLRGAAVKTVSGRVLTSAKIQDHNTFEQPEKVKPAVFTGAALKGNVMNVKMPPFSVVVLELK
ncbi:MAG: alpha-L-arabinofuranosidase C-terminal domain-containing protein, partial [Bacteroidota bacterium]